MSLLRLLILGALVWVLVRLFKGLLSPAVRQPQAPSGGPLQGGELVQDPKCGVYVPKDTAIKGPGGQFFCSPECRDAHGNRQG